MRWDEVLLKRAQEIVRYGQGQLMLNVGPSGVKETNILIQAGETQRFIIDRIKTDNLED